MFAHSKRHLHFAKILEVFSFLPNQNKVLNIILLKQDCPMNLQKQIGIIRKTFLKIHNLYIAYIRPPSIDEYSPVTVAPFLIPLKWSICSRSSTWLKSNPCTVFCECGLNHWLSFWPSLFPSELEKPKK